MKRKASLIALLLCIACLCSCTVGGGMEIPTVSVLDSYFSESEEDPTTVPTTDEATTEETTTSKGTPETEESTSIEPKSESLLLETSTFEIHFLDVGQADAALVLCDDEAMLIDGGNAEDSDLIYSYLKTHSINHLEYMICTHPHEDHVGGLSGALNYATVGTVYCSMRSYDSKTFDSFERYVEKQGKEIEIPSAGETFTLGSSTVSILGPVGYYSDPNNMSIVLQIQYGNTIFLFTGDAEIDSEQDILNTGTNLKSTLLKVGHHGSDTSTSYRWLREIAPEYAIISVGKNNSYGHPTEQTLSRLQDAEVTLYRTDLQGHIICTSNGETLTFTTERNTHADTFNTSPSIANSTTPTAHQAEATASATAPSSTPKTSYVLNTNTKKFHYPHCSSVKQMADKNRQDVTLTREEIIAQGYTPCGRCNP